MKHDHKNIVGKLLKFGKAEIKNWSKEKFVNACMKDYMIDKETAEKVYDGYHEAVAALEG